MPINDEKGYTYESLRMLESEEGQTNAIFACFGSAAQHGWLFEVALEEFLLTYNKLCKKSLDLNDLEAIEKKLSKQTMGRLLAEFRKHVTIDDHTVEQCMDSALQKRNFLIHHFFRKRQEKFRTEKGRMELLAELVAIERELKHATDLTNGMRVAVSRKLGLNNDSMKAEEGDTASDTLFSFEIATP